MVEIGMWMLAAILFCVVCVAAWLFLKLFLRLIFLVIAVSFFIAFLYQYSLLPESLAKRVEEVIFQSQEIINQRFDKKELQKKPKAKKRAEYAQSNSYDVVFC